jgi:hypothetical protein
MNGCGGMYEETPILRFKTLTRYLYEATGREKQTVPGSDSKSNSNMSRKRNRYDNSRYILQPEGFSILLHSSLLLVVHGPSIPMVIPAIPKSVEESENGFRLSAFTSMKILRQPRGIYFRPQVPVRAGIAQSV